VDKDNTFNFLIFIELQKLNINKNNYSYYSYIIILMKINDLRKRLNDLTKLGVNHTTFANNEDYDNLIYFQLEDTKQLKSNEKKFFKEVINK
jgi:hypothetical protein